MKVKDLIAILEEGGGENEVMLNGYEGGYTAIITPKIAHVKLIEEKKQYWWWGEYEDDENGKMVMVLSRYK
jgi:hypothetical protein